MLTGEDIQEARDKANFEAYLNRPGVKEKLSQYDHLVTGKPEPTQFAWVIEKTLKDGSTAYEFPSDLTEIQAKDHADSILGSTPGIDSVTIYRKVGTIKRVQSTIWE